MKDRNQIVEKFLIRKFIFLFRSCPISFPRRIDYCESLCRINAKTGRHARIVDHEEAE